jgi:superfamily II DNA or RNA helicase/Holliday junction resolvase
MLKWFGFKTKRPWNYSYSPEGIHFREIAPDTSQIPDSLRDLDFDPAIFLEQLQEEGLAEPVDGGYLLTWPQYYAAVAIPGYASMFTRADIPLPSGMRPALRSSHSFIDPDFTIAIHGWLDEQGHLLTFQERQGAAVRAGGQFHVLSQSAYELAERVREFHQRSDRSDLFQRKAWGMIRSLALRANANLDQFLGGTVILTPEKLNIEFREVDVAGDSVIEVSPEIEGLASQEAWIHAFDAHAKVQDRYDIPSIGGIVQVIPSDPAKEVLRELKRWDYRRVAGNRAEAFLANPYAALGESAEAVIDPAQFEKAREKAGLVFPRFYAAIEFDAAGCPLTLGILIESPGEVPSPPHCHLFADDEAADRFIATAERQLAGGRRFIRWEKHRFEVFPETAAEVDKLKAALRLRREPQVIIRTADIYDLGAYSDRVEGIGEEPSYFSPYITKKKDDEGWFPENILPVIAYTPEGQDIPVAVPLARDQVEALAAMVGEARQAGLEEVAFPGLDKPLPVRDAEIILNAFGKALSGELPEALGGRAAKLPEDAQGKGKTGRGKGNRLLLKANIQQIDYLAQRDLALRFIPREPEIPKSLRPHVELKPHQRMGLAKLQHLFDNAPRHCRGVLLADDMGLGKTLQMLALIVWAFEKDPDLDPALVVAPISLLDNWREEISKFFEEGSLEVLIAYDTGLRKLYVPKDSIEEQLLRNDLVDFLRPGWRGDTQIVLTTYETLRNLEISFARERWSIMVADEAQKIKNPSALMTRSAKKQNVRFAIACTGTPVENTLVDLWCLFDFIQPGLLGALNEFGAEYRKPIEAKTQEQHERIEGLRKIIEVQVIRRMKEDIADDLPAKIESAPRLKLSGYQRDLYASALERFHAAKADDCETRFKSHLSLLAHLKTLCSDPHREGLGTSLDESVREYRRRSPKFDWLLQTLDKIKYRDEKAIIFCEYRDTQRVLKKFIWDTLKLSVDIVNGSTSAAPGALRSRQKIIHQFQRSPGFGVIILSPVAVGFGVNVQAANHVVHFTRHWNPAKEDQATDRAYRIGQTKDVHVYYPIVYADDFTTFDVKLHQLLMEKRSLARDMLNGAGDLKPSDFSLGDMMPPSHRSMLKEAIGIEDVVEMTPDFFESFVAALWTKQGFNTVIRTPASGDNGVDVVAIAPPKGVLIQCKTTTNPGIELGWEAVKDVVAGTAAYEKKYPGISFERIAITNQGFNKKAQEQALLNSVQIIDQNGISRLLEKHSISFLDAQVFI